MPEKQCTKCKEVKPLAAFGKNCHAPDGLQWHCRVCVNTAAQQRHTKAPHKKHIINKRWRDANPAKSRKAVNAWHAKNSEKVKRYARGWRLKRDFNMTIEDYENRLTAQNGVCAICHQPPTKKRLAVDHDHATGCVRGLLCDNCNFGLGRLGDSLTALKAAVAYLEAHKANKSTPCDTDAE